MKYNKLLEQTAAQITEIMPWDFEAYLTDKPNALVVDVREVHEFEQLRLQEAINAPRGILESCCLWNFNETLPELARAQQSPVLLLCRSGHRSAFAALVMQQLGFEQVVSLKLGLKGLNDESHPIVDDKNQRLEEDWIERALNPALKDAQLSPDH